MNTVSLTQSIISFFLLAPLVKKKNNNNIPLFLAVAHCFCPQHEEGKAEEVGTNYFLGTGC